MSTPNTTPSPPKPFLQAAAGADLDPVEIQRRADQVLDEPLYWFPVRHHSPNTAAHLEQAILARNPKVIFIEGPADAGDLITHIVDSRTKPPVAVYCSYRDDANVLGLAGVASPAEDVPAKFASFYPLTSYSPEYVAMKTARKIGAEVVFIDLPHHGLIRPADAPSLLNLPANDDEDDEPEEESFDAEDADDDPDSPVDDHDPNPHTLQPNEDALFEQSGFYQRLAKAGGYRSWHEAWDALFENTGVVRDHEAFRRELAYFCAAVRATSPAELMQVDGTLPRERFMWRTITAYLKTHKLPADQAMVVCGGFHLFLDRDDPTPPPELPAGTVFNTVMPYSYFRISELSGYGAGNRAPMYYQHTWDMRTRSAEDRLVEYVVDVLKKARRKGERLSAADAIAVSQHARMLARLRGRREPVLDDVTDALMTCCCKGNPNEEGEHLRRAIDEVNIGSRVGSVTPALGHLPIVNDFYKQIDALGLTDVMGAEKVAVREIDQRDPDDARRSAFLHRLTYLGAPLGEQLDAQTALAGGTIFKERWRLRWSPKLEPTLIEQNLYGDDIESAASAKLREELAKSELEAGASCGRLVQAIGMDLPDMIVRAEDACGKSVDEDSRFTSLSEGLRWLQVLERHAVFRRISRVRLLELIERCFDRACFALPDAGNVPPDQQNRVVDGLMILSEAVQRAGDALLDKSLFADHLRLALNQTQVHFLRGAFLGLLVELREATPQDLADRLKLYSQQPTAELILAGEFLEGAMAVSRLSILLGADALIAALDDLLRVAPWEAFLSTLPRLRAAFERLHDRQRDSLAEHVATRYGLVSSSTLTELSTSVAAASLIARIDRQVAEIMQDWRF